jgi:hypothetical protein
MQERSERPHSPSPGAGVNRVAESKADTSKTMLTLPGMIAARLDTIAQTLFTAGLIADVLQRLWERDPQEGRARLIELRRLARGALVDVRALLADLRSEDHVDF